MFFDVIHCLTTRSLCALVLGAGLLPLALAQHDGQSLPLGAPTSTCDFHGARALDHLRVFNGTAGVPYVYECGQNRPAGTCLSRILNPTKPLPYDNSVIGVDHTQGAWSCVSAGRDSGWVPTDRLSPLPATPAITTAEWLGTWFVVGGGTDSLTLTRSKAGRGIIHVSGDASHTNAANNVNIGGVDADAVAAGPFLHIVDGEDDMACILDLKYNASDHSFRATDNGQCGGFNVSFDGDYK